MQDRPCPAAVIFKKKRMVSGFCSLLIEFFSFDKAMAKNWLQVCQTLKNCLKLDRKKNYRHCFELLYENHEPRTITNLGPHTLVSHFLWSPRFWYWKCVSHDAGGLATILFAISNTKNGWLHHFCCSWTHTMYETLIEKCLFRLKWAINQVSSININRVMKILKISHF